MDEAKVKEPCIRDRLRALRARTRINKMRLWKDFKKILLILAVYYSFHYASVITAMISNIGINLGFKIVGVSVHLLGAFLPFMLGSLIIYTTFMTYKTTKKDSFTFTCILCISTFFFYLMGKETDLGVIYNSFFITIITHTLTIIGISSFLLYHPLNLHPYHYDVIIRLSTISSVLWLSPIISESVHIIKWQLYGSTKKIDIFVLGGAGLNDVIFSYGFLSAATILLFFSFYTLIIMFESYFITKKTQIVVYYDPSHSGSWFNNENGFALQIMNHFKEKKIQVVDANKLKQFIDDSLKNGISHYCIIVFSQDKLPNTIVEDYFSTTTIREFLDYGGSILWAGDIPCFYITYPNDPNLGNDAWSYGAASNILGITPLFSNPKTPVNISIDGSLLGMKHIWSGVRPIFSDNNIIDLASSENLYARPHAHTPPYRKYLERFWDFIRRIRHVSFTGLSFSRPDPESSEKKNTQEIPRRFHETYFNAWFKSYNDKYKFSGFYRIWDYNPRRVSIDMLEELFEIANNIANRLESYQV